MKSRIFEEDDYGEVQQKYFTDLINDGNIDADPSGWLLTYSEAGKYFSLPKTSPRDFTKYHVDEGLSLSKYKKCILSLMSTWENSGLLTLDNFTLCPSGGCASLVVLATLKGLGVKKILFETPAYFATIEQASELGLQFELLPTYRDEGYELKKIGDKIRRSGTALWITQPRAALGFNQPYEILGNWARHFGKSAFLVSDEVTDQTFPSHLRNLDKMLPQVTVLRIRSFTKGIGLNGLRLATIMHSQHLRKHIVNSLETFGGSIDAHSLMAIADLTKYPSRFKRMLNEANIQVNSLRVKAERLVTGSAITVNRLSNGYIGSMVANLHELGDNQRERRERLLNWCRLQRTPIMLGNSFYMASSPPTEAIRLNFFNRPEHITRGIENILRLWQEI